MSLADSVRKCLRRSCRTSRWTSDHKAIAFSREHHGPRIASNTVLEPHQAEESELKVSVECRILRYLLAHPAAADSAEGVRDWWLHDTGEVSNAVVADALEGLIKRGWLVMRGNINGTNIYAFNEENADAVSLFLDQAGDCSDG